MAYISYGPGNAAVGAAHARADAQRCHRAQECALRVPARSYSYGLYSYGLYSYGLALKSALFEYPPGYIVMACIVMACIVMAYIVMAAPWDGAAAPVQPCRRHGAQSRVADVCVDMCVDMCVDVCVDVCVDICRHAFGSNPHTSSRATWLWPT